MGRTPRHGFPLLRSTWWKAWLCLGLVLVLLPATGCRPGNATGGPGGPPRGAPAIRVVTDQARLERVAETLSLIGTVMANEMVEIRSETEGIIQSILFEEGQQVEKSQELIRLDDTKLAAQVAEAEARHQLSLADYHRNEQMFQDGLISEQEFDQATAAFRANEASLTLMKRRLKDAHILAPFAGVVGSRQVSPGQVIGTTSALTWLVDLDTVKVEVNVPERFLGQVAIGQTLNISVAAFPKRTFSGKVFFIAPFIDPDTRTALIKARLQNPGHVLKPGMFANLELTLTLRDEAVVIPEIALSRVLDDNQAMVFVVDDNQEAQMRPVKLGVRLAGKVEIREGLQEGETIVVEGFQKLAPGAKVKTGG